MRRAILILLALALVPAAAQAGTITLQTDGLNGASVWINQNSGNWYSWESVTAGAFNARLTVDGVTGDWFDAYCVQLSGGIDEHAKYLASIGDMDNWGGTGPDNTRGERASYLYNHFYADALGSDAKRAGLQLAIWNVLYDTTDSDSSLATGSFRAADVWGTVVSDYGNYYLSGLGTNQWNDGNWIQPNKRIRANREVPGDYQDLIGPPNSAPVPEPGSMLLLGSGLIGLAGAVRRRMPR